MKTGARSSRSISLWFAGASVLLGVSICVSLSMGQLGFLHPGELWNLIVSLISGRELDSSQEVLAKSFWLIRLPRILLALLVGANLAVAGAIMQALFYNPLAEPYVAGVSSGAALGGVLAITTGLETLLGLNAVALLAFAGAMIMSLIVFQVAKRSGRISMASLLLTGIAVGGLAQAITTLLILRSDPYNIRSVLVWLMGSLAFRSWNYVLVLLPYSILGLFAAWFFHRALNAMATGEESAHYLGIPLERTKILLLLIAAILAASAVAASGIIGFIGLMVPHIVRMTLGANHRTLLPGSVLVGGILLLWSDLLARTISPGEEMPIGIVTGVLGCLFFLYLLKQTQRRIF